ncbi:MAG: HAD family hydrolase [Gammaproteobacteria bacterium]|nr:HAD family hydrolase [Gammaproteobacteria bacterium]
MPHRAPSPAALGRRRHWIFDLDGTLTRPVHDFDAIRRELGVPDQVPILEHLATLPREQAEPRLARLHAIERDACARAVARPGAAALLTALRERGCDQGIVSRNSLESVRLTLAAAGLADHFADGDLVGRGEAPPKPDPAGLLKLLEAWSAAAGDAVMVGDFVHDLEAGRAAGVAVVYLDWEGRGRWSELADLTVTGLEPLVALL